MQNLSRLSENADIATKKYVDENGGASPSSAVPNMDGIGASGSSDAFARGDHTHPSDISKLSRAVSFPIYKSECTLFCRTNVTDTINNTGFAVDENGESIFTWDGQNIVRYSTDLWKTFTTVTNCGSYSYWPYKLYILNGIWYKASYVTASKANAFYSTNKGSTWSSISFTGSGGIGGMAYGNGKYVAIKSSNALYSSNGTSWTSVTLPVTASWRSLVFGNGIFVAIAANTATALVSEDGATWTSVTLPSAGNWMRLIFGNGKFLAFATGGNKCIVSDDGESWTEVTLPLTSDWCDAAGNENGFVIVSQSTSCPVLHSMDGFTWEQIPTDYYAQGKPFVLSYGGKFYVFACSHCGYSDNKTTDFILDIGLAASNMPYDNSTPAVSEIAGNPGTSNYPARADHVHPFANVVRYTSEEKYEDLSSETLSLPSLRVAFNHNSSNPIYLAYASANLYKSVNGLVWTAVTSPAGSTTLKAVLWQDSRFILLDNSNYIYTSADGATWTTSSTLNSLVSAPSYGQLEYDDVLNMYFAYGYDGNDERYLYKSSNLTSWTVLDISGTDEELDDFQALHGVLFLNNTSYNICGLFYYSLDGGSTWTEAYIEGSGSYYIPSGPLAYFKGSYFGIFNGGYGIYKSKTGYSGWSSLQSYYGTSFMMFQFDDALFFTSSNNDEYVICMDGETVTTVEIPNSGTIGTQTGCRIPVGYQSKYVAKQIGSNPDGVIYWSLDGINWSSEKKNFLGTEFTLTTEDEILITKIMRQA